MTCPLSAELQKANGITETREYWQWRCGGDRAWNFRTEEEARADHERQSTYSTHTYINCKIRNPYPLVVERMPPGE
jgi:hypothetical protein